MTCHRPDHFGAVHALEFDNRAVGAWIRVAAKFARFSTGNGLVRRATVVGRMDAVMASRKRTRRTAPSPPDLFAFAARTLADFKTFEHDRETPLQHLRIGKAGRLVIWV